MLATLRDFLNTLDERSFSAGGRRHSGGDALVTPAALAGWLAGHGLIPPGAAADESGLAAALDLRAALRGALKVRAARIRTGVADTAGSRARGGSAATAPALSPAGSVLAGLALRVEFTDDGIPRLAAAAADPTRAALAGLAAGTALAEADGTWRRLKICAAPDCCWVFYDLSRSGAGRWCSMRVCGNRGKTRAYRQRQRG